MSLKASSILVIDDDVDVLTAVRLLLRPEVREIVTEKKSGEHTVADGETGLRCDPARYEFQQLDQYW